MLEVTGITKISVVSEVSDRLCDTLRVALVAQIEAYASDAGLDLNGYRYYSLADRLAADSDGFRLLVECKRLLDQVSLTYRDVVGVKLTSNQRSVLGNIIGAWGATYNSTPYTYDVTDSFDWEIGQYENGYMSCLWHWGDKRTVRASMERAGVRAIRFYDPSGEPCGRAFFVSSPDEVVIFNSYGEFHIHEIAEVVKAITGHIHARRVHLANSAGSRLWINGDNGWIVSGKRIDDSDWDLGIEILSMYDSDYIESCRFWVKCEECDGYYPEEEMYSPALCEGCGLEREEREEEEREEREEREEEEREEEER